MKGVWAIHSAYRHLRNGPIRGERQILRSATKSEENWSMISLEQYQGIYPATKWTKNESQSILSTQFPEERSLELHVIFTAEKCWFSDVAFVVRINSPGLLKGARNSVRLGPREKIYKLP